MGGGGEEFEEADYDEDDDEDDSDFDDDEEDEDVGRITYVDGKDEGLEGESDVDMEDFEGYDDDDSDVEDDSNSSEEEEDDDILQLLKMIMKIPHQLERNKMIVMIRETKNYIRNADKKRKILPIIWINNYCSLFKRNKVKRIYERRRIKNQNTLHSL